MISGDISEFIGDDDGDSGNAVLVATRPVLLPLPNLLASVLLLVVEEKSDCNVPELATLGRVLLSGAMGKGGLDCR